MRTLTSSNDKGKVLFPDANDDRREGRVRINAEQYFEGVPPEVWNSFQNPSEGQQSASDMEEAGVGFYQPLVPRRQAAEWEEALTTERLQGARAVGERLGASETFAKLRRVG